MRIFGLIGYPLIHSFSEKYFKEKFDKEQIKDVRYKKFPIQTVNAFHNLVKSNKNLLGLNVTAPYKEVIIPFLDELDFSASSVNAVNVIKIIRKAAGIKLVGYNTDVYGFQNSLEKKLRKNIKSALILGTGGAGKAVACALKKLSVSFQFVSRNNIEFDNILKYNELTKDLILNNLLIINATPLGIYPEINQKPNIPYKYITENHHLFDLIYNPAKTQFLKEGEKRNALIQNGLEMLHLQADKAWEIFTDNEK